MEYTLTEQEKAFVQALKSQVTLAKAAAREAQASLEASKERKALTAAEADEQRIAGAFEGALKLLLSAHGMQQATLSEDCSKIVSNG